MTPEFRGVQWWCHLQAVLLRPLSFLPLRGPSWSSCPAAPGVDACVPPWTWRTSWGGPGAAAGGSVPWRSGGAVVAVGVAGVGRPCSVLDLPPSCSSAVVVVVFLPRTALETTLLVRHHPFSCPCCPSSSSLMCVAQLRKPRGATERHVQVSVGEVRATQPEPHPAGEGLSLALVNIQGVAERHRTCVGG